MRRWWQLATRNWWTKPGRTLASVLSVAMGVGTVVCVTGIYETVRRVVADDVVANWVGTAHLSVEPPGAHWGRMQASLADSIAELPNVAHVTARLKRRMHASVPIDQGGSSEKRGEPVDALGINPQTEEHFRTLPGLVGRMFDHDQRDVAVIEDTTAEVLRVGVGDTIRLLNPRTGAADLHRIVGVFESQRLAEFQKPIVYLPIADVQELCEQDGAATVIDVMLDDGSQAGLAASKRDVESLIAREGLFLKVSSAAARRSLLEESERITRTMIMVLALLAMLTAFFIILTTMSMSLFERRPILGMMRCVGMTRMQLSLLLLIEMLPLGVIGTIAGLVGGMGITRLMASLPRWPIETVHFDKWGLGVAVCSGLVTTLVSTLALVVQVCRVTPLVAVYPQARPVRMSIVMISGVVGLALIGWHEWMLGHADEINWFFMPQSVAASLSLYMGYILLGPAAVVLIAGPASRLVGRMMRLNGKLAEDQLVRTPWRSAAICWMLMVGLSLIVYTAVRMEGAYAIWSFPAQLPETFVWSATYVPGEKTEEVRSLPGVASCWVITDVACEITTEAASDLSIGREALERILRKFTRPVFVAGELDQITSMMKVTFTEGTREDAIAKLKEGGHVLLPAYASAQHDLHLGDRIGIRINDVEAEFTVAGVVQWPAMEITVTFFRAESYLKFAGASAVLGTREDLADKFGLDVASMFMCDIDLPPAPVPELFRQDAAPDSTDSKVMVESLLAVRYSLPNQADYFDPVLPSLRTWLEAAAKGEPPDEAAPAVRRFGRAMRYVSRRWHRYAPDLRLSIFRERLVLMRIADVMEQPRPVMASVTRLKAAVDKNLRRAMVVLTWIPIFVLIVAAIGIGNLMMVSVHMRSRQIAILRAVGAQKSQIVRLILTEAITLGMLGSAMGLAFGFHEARSVNIVAEVLSGIRLDFVVPLGTISAGIALSVTVCLISGIGPARHAARNNIISAMQTT